jgi:hypothetical protein
VVDTISIKKRRTPFHAVNDITLFQQKFGQVRSVLASDTGDECDFLRHGKLLDYI